MSKPPDTAGAIQAMKAASRGPRIKSPVYEWLAARHDELVAAFESQPPKWKALAAYLAQGGVKNADGQPPSAATVRTSWLRVEASMAARKHRRPPAGETRLNASDTPRRSDPDPPPKRARATSARRQDDHDDDADDEPNFDGTLKG